MSRIYKPTPSPAPSKPPLSSSLNNNNNNNINNSNGESANNNNGSNNNNNGNNGNNGGSNVSSGGISQSRRMGTPLLNNNNLNNSNGESSNNNNNGSNGNNGSSGGSSQSKRLGMSPGLTAQERIEQLRKDNQQKLSTSPTSSTNSPINRPPGSYLNRNNSAPVSPSITKPSVVSTTTSPMVAKTPPSTTSATQRLEQMKLNAENAKKNAINVPKMDAEARTSMLKAAGGERTSSGRPTSVAFLKMQELREKERQKRLMRMSKRQSKRASKVQLNSKLTDFLTIMQKIESQFQLISVERAKMEEESADMKKRIELLETQVKLYKQLESFSTTQIDSLKNSLRQPNSSPDSIQSLKTKIDSFSDVRAQKLRQIDNPAASPNPLAPPPPPSMSNMNDLPPKTPPRVMGTSLLDQIQKGAELKKVETNVKTGFSDSIFKSLHDTIQLALDIRKKAMEDDSDSDSDEDDDDDWFASEEKFEAAVNTQIVL